MAGWGCAHPRLERCWAQPGPGEGDIDPGRPARRFELGPGEDLGYRPGDVPGAAGRWVVTAIADKEGMEGALYRAVEAFLQRARRCDKDILRPHFPKTLGQMLGGSGDRFLVIAGDHDHGMIAGFVR